MRFLSRTALAALAAAMLAAVAVPDEILLRGGGRVSGVIVERTNEAVSIETAPGRLTLSMKRVERIVEGRSALEEFQERAASLAPGEADGWAALARWAADRGLATCSREAWQRVVAVDPAHPEANAALGRVRLDGEWVTEGEAYRARGYVEYEGRWVTPAEHEALLRQRAADEAALRESREADLRVREAEARAREAEARAREAEAAGSTEDAGIPLWWGWGGSFPLYPPFPDQPFYGTLPPDGTTQPGPQPPSTSHPRPNPPQTPHTGPTPQAPRSTAVIGPVPPSGPAAGSMLPARPERPSSRPSETATAPPD